MTVIDIIAIHLAVLALMEAWIDGSIFKDLQMFLEERDHTFLGLFSGIGLEIIKILTPTADKLAELLSCTFCLSYHIPWALLLLLRGIGAYDSEWFIFLTHSLAMTFILNRAMNLSTLTKELGRYVSARNISK